MNPNCTRCGQTNTEFVAYTNWGGQKKERWSCKNDDCRVSFLAPRRNSSVVNKITIEPELHKAGDGEYIRTEIGIPCPKCGNHPWLVVSTRKGIKRTKRYHKCNCCGYTGNTSSV